ncbi:MAG: hypothetical protein ACI4V5_06460 [Prevotella sp.]
MGFKYTKKKEDDERQEHTVQAEDFAKLMVSLKRNPEKNKELPKTESPE